MGIGNLGLAEIVIIGLFVLVFFGPGRLPEIARSLGQTLRQFKKGMNEIKRELEEVERSSSGSGGSPGERPSGRLHPPSAGGEEIDAATPGGDDADDGDEDRPAGRDDADPPSTENLP